MGNDRKHIAEALQPHTQYVVEVSHHESQPIHKAIFFHSADGKGTVYRIGYSQLIHVDYRTVHYMLIGEPFYLEEM